MSTRSTSRIASTTPIANFSWMPLGSWECSTKYGSERPITSVILWKPFSSIQPCKPRRSSPIIPMPKRKTAVQICKVLAPRRRNSTPSCQVVIPPLAAISRFTFCAISAVQRKAIGFKPKTDNDID